MRDYSKVGPQFWTGDTGKAIRKLGSPEARIVAMYLITSPHANMLGLYHCPLAYISHDTGIPIEGASKALASLSEVGFCQFDEASEYVWVFEMARFQIAESLEVKDLRCKGIAKEYAALSNNRFLKEFFEKYGAAFHMELARASKGASQAPSKPRAGTGAGERTGGKDIVGQQPDTPPPARNGHDHEKARELRRQALIALTFLNEKTGRNYEPVPANVDPIVARLKQGSTLDDIRAVIAKKCREWSGDEKMAPYLRPKTLFNATNFANYKGELEPAGSQQ
jgi:uncharacterized phage protein (TIGR02220 family)